MALTMFASTFYTMLWTLLLVVPGIVKGFSYALTPLVAIDHPDWGANRCITESRRLMAGNKWRLFKLLLSFIGWIVLIFAFVLASQIAINLGGSRMQPFLAFVLLAPNLLQPYVCTAFARFYEEILDEDESKGRQ